MLKRVLIRKSGLLVHWIYGLGTLSIALNVVGFHNHRMVTDTLMALAERTIKIM